jgi:hypothetical protein
MFVSLRCYWRLFTKVSFLPRVDAMPTHERMLSYKLKQTRVSKAPFVCLQKSSYVIDVLAIYQSFFFY